jgi:hypothetical protein
MYDNDQLNTDILVGEVLRDIIPPRREALRQADSGWKLDKLLTAMLQDAPGEKGRRYVAEALHISHLAEKDGKEPEAVIKMAKAWKEHLFRPGSSFLKTIPFLTS